MEVRIEGMQMQLIVLKIDQLCLDFFMFQILLQMIYHFCYTEVEKMLRQLSQLAATHLIATLSKY